MYNKKIIETKRLILRTFEEEDYSDFCEYISDYRVNKYLGISKIQNPKTFEELFKANMMNPFCWAAELKDSKKVIGDFHFDNIVENYLAHYGFALNYKYQKQGYGFEASEKIISFALNVLDFKRIRAISLIYNKSSINLLEKLGFEREALIYEYDFGGTIRDVFYFSKINCV